MAESADSILSANLLPDSVSSRIISERPLRVIVQAVYFPSRLWEVAVKVSEPSSDNVFGSINREPFLEGFSVR